MPKDGSYAFYNKERIAEGIITNARLLVIEFAHCEAVTCGEISICSQSVTNETIEIIWKKNFLFDRAPGIYAFL